MSISQDLYRELRKAGLDFFMSVPCKFTAEIIALLEKDKSIIYTPVNREEEGMGIAAGAYMAGKKPCIVMQNSGLGNGINAVCSLLNYYSLPVVFLISHRGTEMEKVEAQKPMGKATPALLDTIDIPYIIFKDKKQISTLKTIIQKSFADEVSLAILLPPEFWSS